MFERRTTRGCRPSLVESQHAKGSRNLVALFLGDYFSGQTANIQAQALLQNRERALFMSKSTRKTPDGQANASKYYLDRNVGNGGSIAIKDHNGVTVSVLITEEAMANQSRLLMKPIVRGLIYPGTVGLLVAPPKAGKSNLEFMFAHELAAGRDYLGYDVHEPCCVSIFEFEEGDAVMGMRYNRFPDDVDFFEDGELSIQYSPTPFEFEMDAAGAISVDTSKGLGFQISLWHELVNKGEHENRPGVVFIDTLARALPNLGSGKYSAELNYIGAVHNFAVDLGIAIAFVHHTNKGDHSDAADSISGTNGIAGSCDWTMLLFRDTDGETKKRLPTGRLVCNSRLMSEDELFRWVRLSDFGFWELDLEKEDEIRLRERAERDKLVPKCVKKILTLMRHHDVWEGTASQLMAEINEQLYPSAFTRKINENQEWLAENGIAYWNGKRNKRERLLHFELV